MALKADVKTKIKALGLDVEKLIAAVTATEEVDYEVPEVVVFKQTDLDARDANKITEGKKLGVKEGEIQGKELAAKAIKKKFSIEDETKDIDKVVELVNAKVATGDDGLKEQVKLLLADKTNLLNEVNTTKAEAAAARLDSDFIAMFPTNRSSDLSDSERLLLTKSAITIEVVDGKKVAKKNGEIVRDPTTQNPLEPGKVVSDYFAERKWVTAEQGGAGGRGGGDGRSGGGAGNGKKLSDVQTAWKAANPEGNVMSAEFESHLATVIKDIPDFDFNN